MLYFAGNRKLRCIKIAAWGLVRTFVYGGNKVVLSLRAPDYFSYGTLHPRTQFLLAN